MYRILLLLFATLLSAAALAQAQPQATDTANYPYWIDMMQDPTANFFETQQAFYTYWEGREITKGCGYKPFKRWEYRMAQLVDENGNRPPVDRVAKALEASADRSLFGNWKPLGPAYNQTTQTGDIPGVGRINCIGFHPTDETVFYVGAPSGGVWRTTNNGQTWTELGDDLPTLGISAMVVDHANPNILYIGTGDRDGGDAPGLGIWKSLDAGENWSNISDAMGNTDVNALIQDPINANILIAATDNGIFRTTNAGTNWELTSFLSITFKDLRMHPTNHDVLYSVAGSRMFKSDDNGVNWTLVENLPLGARMVITTSPAEPDAVHALISNSDNGFFGFYRSTDQAVSFTEMSTAPNILGFNVNNPGGQAWYDLCVTSSHTTPMEVYAGGIRVYKSSDGGATWAEFSSGVHVDQHALEIHPITKDLYLGNDGGLYRTDLEAPDWEDISSNLVVGQMYKIGQSFTDANKVMCGFQDNSTGILDGTSWRSVIGGDGFECGYDPTDATYQYGTIYYGDVYRSTNGTNFPKIGGEDVNGIDEAGAWVSPLTLGEHDPNVMFLGLKNVWRTTNLKTADTDDITWTNIGPGISNSNNCEVIEHSPADPNLLFVTKGGGIFRSTDALAPTPSWTSLPGGPTTGSITDIEAHPTDPNIIYALKGAGIIKSEDMGLTWVNLNDGSVPDVGLNCLVLDTATSTEALYVGTEAGVYLREEGFSTWVAFNDNLPASVDVRELEIFYGSGLDERRLRAGTYGRGLWESDLLDPVTRNFPAVPLVALEPANEKQEVYGPFEVVVTYYNNLEAQSVTGFSAGDVAVTNGSISDFDGSGATYTFTVTPTSEGIVTVLVDESAAVDVHGTPTLASEILELSYNPNAPNFGNEGPGGVGSYDEIALWLDAGSGTRTAANGNEVTTSGSPVGAWLDKTGSGLFAVQNTSSQQPILRTGAEGIGGYPAIDYTPNNGNGQFFTATGVVPGEHFSAFSVAASDTTVFVHHAWLASSRMPNGFIMHANNNSNSFYINVVDDNDSYFRGPTVRVNDVDQPHLYGFTYCRNPVTAYEETYLDGNTDTRARTNVTSRSNTASIDIRYGYDYDQRYANGRLAEHIIYNEFAGRTHQTLIRNYFSSKYDLNLGDLDRYAYDDAYPHDVAGIGRESEYDLHSDARGTGLVRMQGDFDTDGSYLLWGHNAGAMDAFSEAGPESTMRIERTWRTAVTETAENITVSISVFELPGTSLRHGLLLADDADFTTGLVVYDITGDTDMAGAIVSAFKDGQFFTFVEGTAEDFSLINAEITDFRFSAWPTPNNGNFAITLENAQPLSGTVRLYNAIGQLVRYWPVENAMQTQLQVNNLGVGTYIVRFDGESQSEVIRLVVAGEQER